MAAVSLTESIHMAAIVEAVLVNVTHQIQEQTEIDKGILARLQALEVAIESVGDQQQDLSLKAYNMGILGIPHTVCYTLTI